MSISLKNVVSIRVPIVNKLLAVPTATGVIQTSNISCGVIVPQISTTTRNVTTNAQAQNTAEATTTTTTRNEKVAAGAREAGTVKWFDSSKGFGFITRESGEDIFVHYTAIKGDGYRALEEGARVEFAIGSGKKGPAAVDVVNK